MKKDLPIWFRAEETALAKNKCCLKQEVGAGSSGNFLFSPEHSTRLYFPVSFEVQSVYGRIMTSGEQDKVTSPTAGVAHKTTCGPLFSVFRK
jgi:hypothetical protein